MTNYSLNQLWKLFRSRNLDTRALAAIILFMSVSLMIGCSRCSKESAPSPKDSIFTTSTTSSVTNGMIVSAVSIPNPKQVGDDRARRPRTGAGKKHVALQIEKSNGKCVAPYLFIPKVGSSRFLAERQILRNFELLNAYFECKRTE